MRVRKLTAGPLALGLALLLGLAACASGKEGGRAAARTPTPSAAPSDPGPAPTEWLADLATDGTTLYVTAHSCPGVVAARLCTIQDGLGAPRELKAYPLNLWRFEDGSWKDLGQPGVFSSADMEALPGGLVFVPREADEQSRGPATGPLRVSLDKGETWEDWQIPEQRRRCRSSFSGRGAGPCTVVVAGEYVVITSNYGWVRRGLHSSDWEDITPPKRRPIDDDDEVVHGVLVLDDGTLVATANNIGPGPGGSYRVSKDVGTTWSAPHANPGKVSELDRADGSTLYATCWKIHSAGKGGTSASECGAYRSTDLEHWTFVPPGVAPDIMYSRAFGACWRSPAEYRTTEVAERVGPLVYGIASVPYVNGHEATRSDLSNLDMRHRVSHVLERSSDECRTWEQVVHGQR